MDVLYNNEGVIEPNEDSLRRMCQAEKNEWKRSWPPVRALLDEVEEKWSHPKVRDTIEKLERYHSQRKVAGKSGAQRRWGNSSANGSAIAQPIRDDSLPQARTSSLPLPQARTIPPPEKYRGDFDFEAALGRIAKRHPKSDGIAMGIALLRDELTKVVDPVAFIQKAEIKHSAYCDLKRGEPPKFVKNLSNWVRELGFNDPEERERKPEWDGYTEVTQEEINAAKTTKH